MFHLLMVLPFIDPRGSQVEIIQAVGRAIRKVRGAKVQKKGTIVLPVFIEDGMTTRHPLRPVTLSLCGRFSRPSGRMTKSWLIR